MRSETLSIVTAPSKSYLSAQIAPSIPRLITFLACLITNMLPLEQHYKRVLFHRITYGIWNISTFSTLSVFPQYFFTRDQTLDNNTFLCTPFLFWEWNLSARGGNQSLKCLMSFSVRIKLKKLLNK